METPGKQKSGAEGMVSFGMLDKKEAQGLERWLCVPEHKLLLQGI